MAPPEYKVMDFGFTWRVEKFFSLFENCNSIDSPTIPLNAFKNTYFTLAIEEPNSIVLTVHTRDELKVKLSKSCIHLNDTTERELRFETTIREDTNEWIFECSQEFSSAFRKIKLNNHLDLKCHMFFGERILQSEHEHSDYETLDLLKLSRDIRKLKDCREFCDIKLQAGSSIFNAHRAILSARLPNLLKESILITDSSNINHVTSVSSSVFEILLKYIYCDKLDTPSFQVPPGLIKAVDSLQLDNLKRKLCSYPNQVKLDTRQFCIQTAYTWSVESISSMKLHSPKHMKFSPVFCSNFDNYCQSEMSFEVVKLAEGTEDDIYFNVSLRYCFEQSSNIYFVKTKTSTLDIFGELQNSQEYQFQVDKSKLQSEVSTWVYRISKNELDDEKEVLLPNDSLTFVIDISIYKADFNIEGSAYPRDSFPDLSFDIEDKHRLSLDMEQIYNSKEYSDLTFTTRDAVFKVHKIVLFSRAPKMLDANCSSVNSIEITDIDSNVLEVLIRYIYTSKLPEMTSGLAIKLYLAAYTYDIHLLKQRCLTFIKNNLVF